MRKHTITIVALLAVLSMVAAGCQKEEIVGSQIAVQESSSTHSVLYCIDGVQHSGTFYTEEEWVAFLDRMFALAEEGHHVSFRENDEENRVVSTKEKVVYTTPNRQEAEAWADIMVDKGYSVSIEYDEATGIYTCTAVK